MPKAERLDDYAGNTSLNNKNYQVGRKADTSSPHT